jgi:hypothetical protein
MLNSAIVETVVGLVFLFYATALVCSGAVEMFANWTKKRAKYLLRGLRELLDDPGESRPNVSPATEAATARAVPTEAAARMAEAMSIVPAAAPGDEAAHYAVALGRHLQDVRAEARLEQLWSTKLIKHPLLKPYKHYNRLGEPTRNPAYLPPSAFAIALLDLVGTQPAAQDASETPAPSNLDRVIGVLRRETKDQPEKLQDSLESWFNGQMDRVTGSYKRWAKRLAIPVAVVVALLFNLDTVAVARSLYTDGAIRSAVLDAAAAGSLCPSSANQPAPTQCVTSTVAGLSELKLPVGWSRQRVAEVPKMTFWQVLSKLFGLLLTVAAASLGAPFWFDLLNRFGSLRNVGTKPTAGS